MGLNRSVFLLMNLVKKLLSKWSNLLSHGTTNDELLCKSYFLPAMTILMKNPVLQYAPDNFANLLMLGNRTKTCVPQSIISFPTNLERNNAKSKFTYRHPTNHQRILWSNSVFLSKCNQRKRLNLIFAEHIALLTSFWFLKITWSAAICKHMKLNSKCYDFHWT